MATPETIFELRRTRSHLVIVLVSEVDRRLIPALHFVAGLPSIDARALHICVDPHETRQLAADWMTLEIPWLPLHIRDATPGGVAASLVEAVRDEAGHSGPVTVVVPELNLPKWWQPLLHRRNARRIAIQLQAVPGITAVVAPQPLPPRTETSTTP